MLTLDEIVERLQGVNHSEIARKTNLTRAYINAIAHGKRVNPTYDTVKKLNDALVKGNE